MLHNDQTICALSCTTTTGPTTFTVGTTATPVGTITTEPAAAAGPKIINGKNTSYFTVAS